MNPVIFLSIFLLLGIVLFIVGLYASKSINSTSDYFLADRSLGIASVTFTLIATQLGGNMVLGTAQQSYLYGYYGMLYAIGMGVGFLLLACGIAARLRACNVVTIAQIFETKYHSPFLKKYASAISILSLCGILVSIVVASRSLIVSLGINHDILFVIFWLLIIGYTMAGGLKAMVMTDIVQVFFIVLSLGSIFLYALAYQPHGFLSVADLCTQPNLFAISDFDASKLLAVFLMPVLFSLIEQDLAQSFFAAKSPRVAIVSAFFAAIFIISFGFIPVYFGMQARAIQMALPLYGNPFISVIELITSDLIFAIAVCGVIAAITSTANALLCAISSNLAQDFAFSAIAPRHRLKLSQAITLLTGIVAVVASYLVAPNILNIAISSYELSVSCLVVPVLAALYKKNLNKNAAFGSAACGALGFVLFRIVPTPISKELVTLALSIVGYIVGDRIKS